MDQVDCLKTRVMLEAVEALQRETALETRKLKPGNGEAVGERLARLRKERGITQEEVAKALGVSQPVVSDYERGELRLHGEQIIELAMLLKISADELLGLERPKKNGGNPNRKLTRRFQQIEQLPQRDQQAIYRTIDAFLAKGG